MNKILAGLIFGLIFGARFRESVEFLKELREQSFKGLQELPGFWNRLENRKQSLFRISFDERVIRTRAEVITHPLCKFIAGHSKLQCSRGIVRNRNE